MTSSPKSLLDLPIELFELMATDHHPTDLFFLRLVCKEIEKKVFEAFASAFFVDLEVLLCSEGSLRRILGVLGSTVFGPRTRSITVFIDEPQPGAVSREALQVAKLKQEGVDRRLLTRIFAKIERLGTQAKVIVATGAQKAHQQKCTQLLQAIRPQSVHNCIRLTTILEAMKSASYKLHKFSMETKEAWSLPILAFTESQRLDLFRSVFTSIRSLTLDVWLEDEDDAHLAKAFFHCVDSCRDLKYLTVYGRNGDDELLITSESADHAIAMALLDKDFLELQVLRLWGCTVFVFTLVGFLRRHQKVFKLEEFGRGT